RPRQTVARQDGGAVAARRRVAPEAVRVRDCEQITFSVAAFAPEALRRASPKLGNYAERRREAAEAGGRGGRRERMPKDVSVCSASSAFKRRFFSQAGKDD